MSNRSTSAKVDRSSHLERLLADIGEWTTGSGPLLQRLARAIAGAIERGELPHGSRLPSERSLAVATWVSRGTVVAAYDVLVGDGLAMRRTGSGTFVIAGDGPGLPQGREGSRLVAHLAERADEQRPMIDLSISVLDDPVGLPDVSVSTRDLAAAMPAGGYDPRGQLGLRTALARHLTDQGLPSEPDQLVVTTGAQQAISTAVACWVRPGDVVLVEDPTYPGALSAFTAAGAELRGLPVDRHGVQPAALARELQDRPALVYLQSALHSPTGVALSPGRRREVARLLVEARVPLVEDIALAGLAWETVAPPIAAQATTHPIAVVGSLSKLFWSGLRVGFVRAPVPVAQRLARIKTTQDLGSSTFGQLAAERLLAHPDTPAFLRRRNHELQHRHRLVVQLLAEHLPTWTVHEPAGGLSQWIRLPVTDASRFAAVALDHGVAVATATALSPSGGHRDHVRLSIAHPEPVLRAGIERLAAAWHALDG